MQQSDQTLIEQLFEQNPRFRMLYEEHLVLEKELERYSNKSFLNAEDELEKKRIQKLKLAGKDEMDRILRQQP